MRRIYAEQPFELQVSVMPETLAFRGAVQELQGMLDNAGKWAAQRVAVLLSG